MPDRLAVANAYLVAVRDWRVCIYAEEHGRRGGADTRCSCDLETNGVRSAIVIEARQRVADAVPRVEFVERIGVVKTVGFDL